MISINVNKFKRGLASIKAKVTQDKLKVIESKVDALVSNLRSATPVDTGFAASRWRKIPGNKPGHWLVVNDAPYIGRLNAGSSQQAPSHFIEQEALNVGRPVGSIVRYTNTK